TYDLPVSGAELGGSLLYALAWTAGLLAVAAALFQRRDFK
ncbi:MAG: ABC transporter permease, partial [Deltaproteobacteria bacterium]|nr:ABC transporter permease [Deltaproteobacteria bacterium]